MHPVCVTTWTDEPCFRIADTVKKGPTFEEKPKGALNYYGVKWSPDGRYVYRFVLEAGMFIIYSSST